MLGVIDVEGEFAVPWTLDDLKVHSHVTTNSANGSIYDGMYDFDIKPNGEIKMSIRNYLNAEAIKQHGAGTPFQIQYRYEDKFFP